MRIAGIQSDLLWQDAPGNHARLAPRVEAAAADGAELVVLPEMFASGFSMETDRVAQAPGGPSEAWMAGLAARTGAAVAGSVVILEPAWERPRNVFLCVEPGGRTHRYAKIHPFSFGGETTSYDAGDELVTFEFGGLRVTPFICYDLRFPEPFALAAEGTDLFVIVANWPRARATHWTAFLAARAIETQAYVLGVNRVGSGAGLEYDGGSALHGPLGDCLAAPDGRVEATFAADVSADEVARVRGEFPFLADRRPDLYDRFRASR